MIAIDSISVATSVEVGPIIYNGGFEMPDIIRDWDGIYRRGQTEFFDNGIGARF